MKKARFDGRRWEQHGDYWILVISKTQIPAAILIPIVPRKEETMKRDEPRIAATIRRA